MSQTIRMNGARKIELQLNMAASGYREVTQAIAGGFTEAHKGVDNGDGEVQRGRPMSNSQKTAGKGLKMTSYGVGNNRVPNITYTLEWRKDYLAKRAAEPSKYSNYLGSAGQGHMDNPQIKDLGLEWGGEDGFAPANKYKYAWQPYVKDGLMRFLRQRTTGILQEAKGPFIHSNQQAIGLSIMAIQKVLAYLKLDAALRHTEATQLVSKRQNPYDDSQYVIRTGTSYSNTDYSNFELLKLPFKTTRLVISKMETVLPLLRNLHAAVNTALSTKRNTTYNINQLKLYRDSLENYETRLNTLVDEQVAEHGSTSMAIEVDTQRRAEIVEYLKAIPHKHLIATEYNAGKIWIGDEGNDPAPQFKCREGLGVDIEKRIELIESTRKSITRYEAAVAADASGLGDLKMQVAVGELKQYALANTWIQPEITGGEEE